MKPYVFLLLFTVFVSYSAISQNFNQAVQQKWQSNFVVGSDDYSATLQQETIQLNMLEDNVYGTFLELNPDGTFTSYNQGFCGNECRIRTNGNYVFNEKDSTITFTLTNITFWKMCMQLNEKKRELPASIGTFAVRPTDNGYSLSRLTIK
jgi:hypothetical protein